MRLALAQIDCRLGNIPANIATHRAACTAIQAQGGADLVLFPELSLTGYRLRSDIYRAMLNAADFAQVWAMLCAEGAVPPAMSVALGYVELTDRSALHNTTALLRGDNAQPLLVHRKVYLPTYGMFEEERYMRPGCRFRIADLPMADGDTWRVGILCCEDAWHSSAWLIMQAYGVDLVLIGSASPGRGVEAERLGSQTSWYGILSTHAELLGCWVAFCNRVGFEDDIHFWGGSAVFAPTGELLAEARTMEADLLCCTIDKSAITTARLMTPLAADEQWPLTLTELKRAVSERWEE